jgi:hypothetical protein
VALLKPIPVNSITAEQFFLEAQTLPSGQTFIFRATICLRSDAERCNTADVTVVVLSAPLVTLIKVCRHTLLHLLNIATLNCTKILHLSCTVLACSPYHRLIRVGIVSTPWLTGLSR